MKFVMGVGDWAVLRDEELIRCGRQGEQLKFCGMRRLCVIFGKW